jgi:hypothetical protein
VAFHPLSDNLVNSIDNLVDPETVLHRVLQQFAGCCHCFVTLAGSYLIAISIFSCSALSSLTQLLLFVIISMTILASC